jgi:ribonucleoside-diphosphate reductase alpha chain
MQLKRLFTTAGKDPLSSIKFVKRRSEIKNPDGSLVFRMDDVSVPESWSQVATDIIAQKYFRKAGIPKLLTKNNEEGIPEWLQPSVADTDRLGSLPEDDRFTSERDSRQVFQVVMMLDLLAKGNYFDSEEAP